jgi:hypothetical protein
MNARIDLRAPHSWTLRRRALLTIELLVGAMAVPCGIALTLNGLGMSEDLLDGSPFDSFLIPGLVLTFVVGTSQLAAAWLLWRGDDRSGPASFAAGVVLLGWILVETLLIHEGRGLQATIFALAVAIIALALPDASRRRPLTSARSGG